MNIGQLLRGVFGELQASEAKSLELKAGQVVRGVVLQVLSEQDALVNIGGIQVRARLETPLQKGQATLLQVQPESTGSQIVLKPLETSVADIPKQSLPEVLSAYGLKDTPENRQAVRELHLGQATVTKETAEAYAKVRQNPPPGVPDEEWRQAVQLAAKRGLPLTGETVQALRQSLFGKPLNEMIRTFRAQTAEALKTGNGGGNAPLASEVRDLLVRIGRVIDELAALPPAGEDGAVADGSRNGVLRAENGAAVGAKAAGTLAETRAQDAPSSAAGGARAASGSAAEAAASGAKASSGSAAEAAAGGAKVASGSAAEAAAGGAKAASGSAAEAAASGAKAASGSAAEAAASGAKASSGSAAEAAAGGAKVASGSAAEAAASGSAAEAAASGAKASSGGAAEAAASGAKASSGGAAEAASHRAPTQTPEEPAPWIGRLLKAMGVEHEQKLARATERAYAREALPAAQGAADGVQPPPHPAGSPAEPAEPENTLKSLLLQLSNRDDAPAAVQESAKQLIQQITGQQLLLTPDRASMFAHVTLMLPLQSGSGAPTAAIHIQSRKGSRGELDASNCRLLFDLNMRTLGNTLLDVQVTDKIVSLRVHNDQPFAAALLEANREEIGQAMESIGYHFLSLKCLPYPEPAASGETGHSAAGDGSGSTLPPADPRADLYRAKPYKGVDIRV